MSPRAFNSGPFRVVFKGVLCIVILEGCTPNVPPARPASKKPLALVAPSTSGSNALPTSLNHDGAAELLHSEGASALQHGDYERAAQLFQRGVEMNPNDEEAHFHLAFAYARLNRSDEAMLSYERCLRLVPTYAEAHNNLGNLLVAKKRIDEGVAHFRAALAQQPENAKAYNNLGKAFALQLRIHEAVPLFRESIRLDAANWDARQNLATAYLSLGRWEESRAELNTLLRENPGMPQARALLAKVDALLAKRVGSTNASAKP